VSREERWEFEGNDSKEMWKIMKEQMEKMFHWEDMEMTRVVVEVYHALGLGVGDESGTFYCDMNILMWLPTDKKFGECNMKCPCGSLANATSLFDMHEKTLLKWGFECIEMDRNHKGDNSRRSMWEHPDATKFEWSDEGDYVQGRPIG